MEALDAVPVALFTRAWIEISSLWIRIIIMLVALFTRAWIEIGTGWTTYIDGSVALFTRAWIEITLTHGTSTAEKSPSSRGRGLKSIN